MQNQYLQRLPPEWKARFLSGTPDGMAASIGEIHTQMVSHYREMFEPHQKPVHRTSMASTFVPLSVWKRLHLELARLGWALKKGCLHFGILRISLGA